jgi:hypothetical protein
VARIDAPEGLELLPAPALSDVIDLLTRTTK